MPLSIGQTLQQRYQIQNILGRGGMGIVYQAYDPVLQRTVAIKVLPPQLTIDAEFVARFQREAIASANLRHAHIVTVHDVGQQDGEYFIIMEYLEGITLEQWLTHHGPMPVVQASKVLDQIAGALDHAHSRGIIHRDVKPSNIMLDAQGRAVLMDFGLVRAGEGLGPTRSTTIMGTPEYMAPEQILGQVIDRRTDIYALGVVVYELLSGKTPFSHTTPLATAYAHVHEAPSPLRSINKAIPQSIEAVVLKALAKDPAARYQSAGDLARDFSQGISGTMPAGLAASPIATVISGTTQQTSSPSGGVIPAAVPPPTDGQAVTASHRGRPGANTFLVTGALTVLAVLMAALLWRSRPIGGDPPPPTEVPSVAIAVPLTNTPTSLVVTVSSTTTPTTSLTVRVEDTATPVVTPSKSPTRAPTATPLQTKIPTPTAAPTHTPTTTLSPTRTATSAPRPTDTPNTAPNTATPADVRPAVTLDAPQLLEPPDEETQINVATLRYSGVSGAASYLVETRSDRPGQQEWRRWPVPGSETTINLLYDALADYFNTPGTVYYWRVAAVGPSDQAGAYSGERRFVFQRPSNATRGSTLEEPPGTGTLLALSGLLGLSFMLAMLFASGDLRKPTDE